MKVKKPIIHLVERDLFFFFTLINGNKYYLWRTCYMFLGFSLRILLIFTTTYYCNVYKVKWIRFFWSAIKWIRLSTKEHMINNLHGKIEAIYSTLSVPCLFVHFLIFMCSKLIIHPFWKLLRINFHENTFNFIHFENSKDKLPWKYIFTLISWFDKKS